MGTAAILVTLAALIHAAISDNSGTCVEPEVCLDGERMCFKCSLGESPEDNLKKCRLIQYNSEDAQFQNGFRLLKSQKEMSYSTGVDPEVKGYSCSTSVALTRLGSGSFAFVMEEWSADNIYLGQSARIVHKIDAPVATAVLSDDTAISHSVIAVKPVPEDPEGPGLETDTDDPQGVFYTLDQLKAMKASVGVLGRLHIPGETVLEVERKRRGTRVLKIADNRRLNRINDRKRKMKKTPESLKGLRRLKDGIFERYESRKLKPDDEVNKRVLMKRKKRDAVGLTSNKGGIIMRDKINKMDIEVNNLENDYISFLRRLQRMKHDEDDVTEVNSRKNEKTKQKSFDNMKNTVNANDKIVSKENILFGPIHIPDSQRIKRSQANEKSNNYTKIVHTKKRIDEFDDYSEKREKFDDGDKDDSKKTRKSTNVSIKHNPESENTRIIELRRRMQLIRSKSDQEPTQKSDKTKRRRHRPKKEWYQRELRLIEKWNNKNKHYDPSKLNRRLINRDFTRPRHRRYRFFQKVGKPASFEEVEPNHDPGNDNIATASYYRRPAHVRVKHRSPYQRHVDLMRKLSKMETELAELASVMQAANIYEGEIPNGAEELNHAREEYLGDLVRNDGNHFKRRKQILHKMNNRKRLQLRRSRLRHLVEDAEQDVDGFYRKPTRQQKLGDDHLDDKDHIREDYEVQEDRDEDEEGEDNSHLQALIDGYKERSKRSISSELGSASGFNGPKGGESPIGLMNSAQLVDKDSNKQYQQNIQRTVSPQVNFNNGKISKSNKFVQIKKSHDHKNRRSFYARQTKERESRNISDTHPNNHLSQKQNKSMTSLSKIVSKDNASEGWDDFQTLNQQLKREEGKRNKMTVQVLINENMTNNNLRPSDKQTSSETRVNTLNKTLAALRNASALEKINRVMNNLDQPRLPLGGPGAARTPSGIDDQTDERASGDARTQPHKTRRLANEAAGNRTGIDRLPLGSTRRLNWRLNQRRLYKDGANHKTVAVFRKEETISGENKRNVENNGKTLSSLTRQNESDSFKSGNLVKKDEKKEMDSLKSKTHAGDSGGDEKSIVKQKIMIGETIVNENISVKAGESRENHRDFEKKGALVGENRGNQQKNMKARIMGRGIEGNRKNILKPGILKEENGGNERYTEEKENMMTIFIGRQPTTSQDSSLNVLKKIDSTLGEIQRVGEKIASGLETGIKKRRPADDDFQKPIEKYIRRNMERGLERFIRKRLQRYIKRFIRKEIESEMKRSTDSELKIGRRRKNAKNIKVYNIDELIANIIKRGMEEERGVQKTMKLNLEKHTENAIKRVLLRDGQRRMSTGFQGYIQKILQKMNHENKQSHVWKNSQREGRKAFATEIKSSYLETTPNKFYPVQSFSQAGKYKNKKYNTGTPDFITKAKEIPKSRRRRSSQAEKLLTKSHFKGELSKPEPETETEMELRQAFVELINRLPASPKDAAITKKLRQEDFDREHPLDVEKTLLKIQDEEDEDIRKGNILNKVWFPNLRIRREGVIEKSLTGDKNIPEHENPMIIVHPPFVKHNLNGKSLYLNKANKKISLPNTSTVQKLNLRENRVLLKRNVLSKKSGRDRIETLFSKIEPTMDKGNSTVHGLRNFLIDTNGEKSSSSFEKADNSILNDQDNRHNRLSQRITSRDPAPHFLSQMKNDPSETRPVRKRDVYGYYPEYLYKAEDDNDDSDEYNENISRAIKNYEDDKRNAMKEEKVDRLVVKQNGRLLPEIQSVGFVPSWIRNWKSEDAV